MVKYYQYDCVALKCKNQKTFNYRFWSGFVNVQDSSKCLCVLNAFKSISLFFSFFFL